MEQVAPIVAGPTPGGNPAPSPSLLECIATRLRATGRSSDTLTVWITGYPDSLPERYDITITAEGQLLVNGRDETDSATGWIRIALAAKRAGHARRAA